MVRAHRLGGGESKPTGVRSSPCACGGWKPPWRKSTGWGVGVSSPTGGRNSRCACGGWWPPMARAHRLGGQGVRPRWLELMLRLKGMAAPNGAGPWARGKGSPAQPVFAPHCALGDGVGSNAGATGSPTPPLVAAHGAPVGDGNPPLRGLTRRGDVESSSSSGCSPRCACGGWQPQMARAHMLGGRGV